ncbi:MULTISPECIES: hypothetical protein [Bradyrhizobium]|uniref:hypothetical protein n=1 Tax=Bradyrhizobium TaxID=374 RepID=UPI001B8A6A4A|nr:MULTISPECIES: hypothetical protein [Bradyrhizobium]MBR0973888.1 hypothetical protein [Bradyrhizobium japonicum]
MASITMLRFQLGWADASRIAQPGLRAVQQAEGFLSTGHSKICNGADGQALILLDCATIHGSNPSAIFLV